MSDPFNSLISTGAAPALFAASNMFGQQRARNDVLQDQATAREQNMIQFMLASGAQERQSMREQRQFELQSQAGDRSFALQREESAFARLNSVLDRQLQAAELESKDRQLAFENSLKAMSVAIDAKAKGMQLKQIERQVAGAALEEEGEAILMQMGAGALPVGAGRDSLMALMAKPGAGGMSPEKKKLFSELVPALNEYLGGRAVGPTDGVGARMSLAHEDSILATSDYSAAEYSTELRSAFGSLLTRAGVAEGSPSAQIEAVKAYADRFPELPHLRNIGKQLENPVVVDKLTAELATKLIVPDISPANAQRLYSAHEKLARLRSTLDVESDGLWEVLPEYRRERNEYRRLERSILAEATSGDAASRHVASGMVPNFAESVYGLGATELDTGSLRGQLFAAAVMANNLEATVPEGITGVGQPRGVLQRVPFLANALVLPVVVRASSLQHDMDVADMWARRIEDAARAGTIMADAEPDPVIADEMLTARDGLFNHAKQVFERTPGGYFPLAFQQRLDFNRLYPMEYAERLTDSSRRSNPAMYPDYARPSLFEQRRMRGSAQGAPAASSPGGAQGGLPGFNPD